MAGYFTVGKLVNTQGIKGEVRVIPTTDDITRFEDLEYIYIDKKGTLEKYEIQAVRYHKSFVLLKFKGIDNMTEAEALKGYDIKIDEEFALECEEDEYYIRDLYDMEVYTTDNKRLGTIKDIIFTGANDVYVIKTAGKDILIPAIKDCIIEVDTEQNKMLVNLLEGLI